MRGPTPQVEQVASFTCISKVHQKLTYSMELNPVGINLSGIYPRLKLARYWPRVSIPYIAQVPEKLPHPWPDVGLYHGFSIAFVITFFYIMFGILVLFDI